ncbi:MAG: hypothetical protein E7673_01445 [Ruminococcaceae bacterium]|nr:hypothetical protein [Oscillospiraceae bacterium]
MKLEKVIIDGKEYYRKIDDEEIIEAEFVGAENESEEKTSEKSKKDAREFFEKVGQGAKDFGNKIVDGAKTIGGKITSGAKDLGAKIKEGTERLFNRDKSNDPNSTEAKLLRLLPYMSREDAHEVCEKILASDEMMKKINVAEIMPFVSSDDCDALFLKSIKTLDGECDIVKAVPYVSKSCLSSVVDGYITGEYPELDIDSLYPFLADAEIKKIFYHIINK